LFALARSLWSSPPSDARPGGGYMKKTGFDVFALRKRAGFVYPEIFNYFNKISWNTKKESSAKRLDADKRGNV
jgi:hypothetical protein